MNKSKQNLRRNSRYCAHTAILIHSGLLRCRLINNKEIVFFACINYCNTTNHVHTLIYKSYETMVSFHI